MPKYEIFLEAGLTFDEIEAEDLDEAREKAAKQVNENLQEYGNDLVRNSEIIAYVKDDE